MNQQHTSSILLVPQSTNHQKTVLDYLINKKLLDDKRENQPNLHWFNQEKESFGIETVREIISLSSFASYKNENQFYVLLNFDLATIPAQNALLKTLEEPPEKTKIILTVENLEKLLPTIQSRCVAVKIQSGDKIENTFNQDFLDLFLAKKTYNYGQAIELAETIKTKDEALQLVSGLLKHISSMSSLEKKPSLMENLLNTYRMIEQNVNIKLALENCLFEVIKNQQQ